MKLQNLLKQNKETITDYMNRAASYLRSMEQGAVTKDGYNLAEDLTVYEQEKLKEYIYCMAFDEMKKTVGRHALMCVILDLIVRISSAIFRLLS